MLIKCANLKKNPRSDPNKTGCESPRGTFIWDETKVGGKEWAEEDEEKAESFIVACSYCGWKHLVWLKMDETDNHDLVQRIRAAFSQMISKVVPK